MAEFAEHFADSVLTNGSKEGHISRVGANPAPSDISATEAENTAAPKYSPPNARPDSPWRDRGKPKAGPRPHRKGHRVPGPPGVQQARRTAPLTPRAAASKYAHKKKSRAKVRPGKT